MARIVDGVEVRYLIDANRPYAQVIEEYSPGGILLASHVYGPGGYDRLSQTLAGEKSFLHGDHLGSTRIVTDALGAVTDRLWYSAFGEVILREGTTQLDYLFTGEFRDAITGLDYLRARHLDVVTGRFISPDPFEGFLNQPKTLHDYMYVNQNPINGTDPSGEITAAESVTVLAVNTALFAIVGSAIGFAYTGGPGGLVLGAIVGGAAGALIPFLVIGSTGIIGIEISLGTAIFGTVVFDVVPTAGSIFALLAATANDDSNDVQIILDGNETPESLKKLGETLNPGGRKK